MGALKKLTISLPEEMLAEIKAALEAGEFTTASQAIRDALQQWRRARSVLALNDTQLRRLLAEARASSQPVDTGGDVRAPARELHGLVGR
jgi:antitoxin ParD1/3/4